MSQADDRPQRAPSFLPAADQSFLDWLAAHDPLPFLSSASILAGIWLLSGSFGQQNWLHGKLLLDVITQIYEFSLIFSVAWMVRASRWRAAAILAILECLFLFDCAFNTEVMPQLEGYSWFASGAWLALVVVKIEMLVRALRLRGTISTLVLPFSMTALIGIVPQILDDVGRGSVASWHIGATWCAALIVALMVRRAAPIATRLDEADCPPATLTRIWHGVLLLWCALLTAHLVAWMVVFSVELTLAHLLAPAMAILVAARRTSTLWVTLGALSLQAFAVQEIQPQWAYAIILAIVVCRARELRDARLLAPVVLALALATSTLWPTAAGHWIADAIGMAALLYLATRTKSPAIAITMLPLAFDLKDLLPALSRGSYGGLLVVVGFLALAMSVWIQSHQGDASHPSSSSSS